MVAFFNNSDRLFDVFANGRKEIIQDKFQLHPEVITSDNFEEQVPKLQNLEIIYSTWGMPLLNDEQIKRLPNLKCVMYAAGSVKNFAEPFLNNGIRVVSAAESNSVPVAEFCLAQILLAAKGYFQNQKETKAIRNNDHFGGAHIGKGAYGETVAFISVGKITKCTIDLLKAFNFNKVAVSHSLSDEYCSENEIAKISMEEAFSQAYIVSNHLPDREDNKGVINYKLLSSMRRGATFINTGRGAQVNENDLIRVMKERPDLCALIDVTDPEPADPKSELFDLPNIYITSHLAGSVNDEYVRMADFVIEQTERLISKQDLRGEVTLEDLQFLA